MFDSNYTTVLDSRQLYSLEHQLMISKTAVNIWMDGETICFLKFGWTYSQPLTFVTLNGKMDQCLQFPKDKTEDTG